MSRFNCIRENTYLETHVDDLGYSWSEFIYTDFEQPSWYWIGFTGFGLRLHDEFLDGELRQGMKLVILCMALDQ